MKIHYHIHNSLPLGLILKFIQFRYSHSIYWRYGLLLSFPSMTRSSKGELQWPKKARQASGWFLTVSRVHPARDFLDTNHFNTLIIAQGHADGPHSLFTLLRRKFVSRALWNLCWLVRNWRKPNVCLRGCPVELLLSFVIAQNRCANCVPQDNDAPRLEISLTPKKFR